MMYSPDYWLMLKVDAQQPGVPYHYKIFATWTGSYLDGASWKLNSGITSVNDTGNYYEFSGHSGSVYRCAKNSYHNTGYGQAVLDSLIGQSHTLGATIDLVPEEQVAQIIQEEFAE